MIDPLVFGISVSALIGAATLLATLRPALIVGYPKTVLAVLFGICIAAGAALVTVSPFGLRLGVDASSEPLLLKNDPNRDVYKQATLSFGSDDLYVIAMETENVFTFEDLTILKDLGHSIIAIDGVRSVDSLADMFNFSYNAEEMYLHIGKFIGDVPEDEEALAKLRERALAHPLFPKVLVSPDGRTAAINVSFQKMTDQEFVEQRIDERIRELLAGVSTENRRYYVTGRPHIRTEAHHLLIGDMLRLIPIAVGIAVVILFLMTGSLRGTIIPLTFNLMATFWAYAAMAAVGVNLTVITLVLGPMLICVGAVYGVHVLARYDIIAADSPDAHTAALRSLEYTRTPVLMAGLTTLVGFGVLLYSDIQATNELGIFAMLGIAAVTMLSLTGAPACLALLPLREADGTPLFGGRNRFALWVQAKIQGRLGGLARFETGYSGRILIFWGLTTLLGLYLIPQIVIDTDYIRFFLPESRVRQDFDKVNELLAGAVPVYVTIHGTEEGTFRRPEILRVVLEIQERISKIEGVGTVLSAVDLVQLAHRALEQDLAEPDGIPKTRGGVAEIMFMIPKPMMRKFATSNHSSANLIVRTGELGSRSVRALQDRIQEAIEDVGLPEDLTSSITGNAVLLNSSADGIAGNQTTQITIAALTILLLVSIVFRSLKLGLLAMIPNVVPVLLFFGTLGAGAAPLSVPTSLIASVALGIAVDNTVHFIVAYRAKRAKGESPEGAASLVIGEVGQPVILSSIMLIIGFLAVTVSSFATLREFGYLTAITMFICMSTDMGLLPALLVRSKI